MNPTRTLATTLAALAATGIVGVATAGATPNCTGRAALNSYTIDIHDGTYTATFTPTPGCQNATITIAAHDTAHLTWDPTETQPLIDSHTVQASAGRLEWTLPAGVAPRCRLQLDLVTGPALDVVDGTRRYNETAIGGTSNRLIDARYTDSPCTPTTTSSTTPEPPASAPTTVTWIDQMPPATVTPIPTQPGIDTPVTDPTTDVQLTPDPTPNTAVPTLPVTGVDTGSFVKAAAWLFAIGGAVLAACVPLRRRSQNVRTRTATTRNMESE